jgi:hypothetical protein
MLFAFIDSHFGLLLHANLLLCMRYCRTFANAIKKCICNEELQISVQESPEPWTKQNLGEAGRTTETVSG